MNKLYDLPSTDIRFKYDGENCFYNEEKGGSIGWDSLMRYLGLVVAITAVLVLLSRLPDTQTALMQENLAYDLEVLSPRNAHEIRQIKRFGNGESSGVRAWSSETETVAVGTSLGLWLSPLSHLEDARFLDLDTKVVDLAFLNEGRYLAYTTAAGTEVIEIATGVEIMRFPDAHIIAAHPVKDYLLVDRNIQVEGKPDYVVQPIVELWDIETQALLQTFTSPQKQGYLHITDIAASPDGRYVAASYSSYVEDTCGHRNSFVMVWDSTEPDEDAFELAGSEYVEFSPNSRFLVSEEFDSWLPDIAALNILDLDSKEVQTLNTMPEGTEDWSYIIWYGFDPTSGQLMSWSEDLLRYWTLPDIQMSHEVEWSDAGITPAEDGQTIITRTRQVIPF